MKKFISVILALVVACSMMVVAVSAYHYKPGSTQKCDNSYYVVRHIEHIGVGPTGSHTHTDGNTCIMTGLTMRHARKCTSCDAILSTYIKTCEIRHSLCEDIYKNCLQ